MKYEDKYKGICFDILWETYLEGDSDIVTLFENEGQVKFLNKNKCKDEFFTLIESWHKNRYIEPQ